MRILEGRSLYDHEGACQGPLTLAEGEKSERLIIVESACGILTPTELVKAEARLEESRGKRGLFALEGRFQMAETQNQNGRMYPQPLWDRVLIPGSPVLNLIEAGDMLGECDHPMDGVTKLQRVLCVTTKLWKNPKDPKEVLGRVVVFNTEKGRDLQAILEGGGRFGVSSRGAGSLVRIDGVDVVQDDYVPQTWDLVVNPSTPGAYPKEVNENTKEVFAIQEQVNMPQTRLEELSKRFERIRSKDVGSLPAEAVDLIREDAEQLKTQLTEESFGEASVKASALVTEVVNYLRDLSSGKAERIDEASAGQQWKKLKSTERLKALQAGGLSRREAGEYVLLDWSSLKRHKEVQDAFEHGLDTVDDDDDLDESIAPTNVNRATSVAEAIEVLRNARAAMGVTDLSEAVREARRCYRQLAEVEGPLTPEESEGVHEYAKGLIEKVEESKSPSKLKAVLRVGSDLNEDVNVAELQCASRAELNEKIHEAVRQNPGKAIVVEVDNSEQVYEDAARRFEPLLHSRFQLQEDSKKARGALSDRAAKLSAAVQIIEVLRDRTKTAEATLTEQKADLEAALSLIGALVEEVGTERLEGCIQGLASTHFNLPDLARDLSEACSVDEAVEITNRKVRQNLPRLRRDSVDPEQRFTEAIKASAKREKEVQKQLSESKKVKPRIQTVEERSVALLEHMKGKIPGFK